MWGTGLSFPKSRLTLSFKHCTYILQKVFSSVSLIFDDPSLFGSFFGFFSLWVCIKTLQCSYYYSSVNWTKGLHGLCWYDIDFETYKLSPGIGALLNTCSYSLVNCMRALHFALCTLHQCWFGIESFAYQLGPSIGYCIKLGISHRNIDMHILVGKHKGVIKCWIFFCILVSKMRS